jgi:hypothetical protein
MNRTVDLSFLDRDFGLYVPQWKNLGYSAAMNCFLAGDPFTDFGVFPLKAVPERCPFKKRELVEAWDCFISMFCGPPEIADQHLISGYEE